ncbi:MAG: LapA family protein [Prolixibacteraceae bacterium]|nr:LapA family protein [Prolixibacteraceae bacterium]
MGAVVIIVLIMAILLVIFTLQNSFEVSVNIFFWKISEVPMVLILICCVLLGYIIASVYFYPYIWKLKKDYKKVLKSNQQLKKEAGINQEEELQEETNPEGIELDPDTDEVDRSFFKD